jgi:multidrug efflux pump subunit AcrA (membrane-fusion protein)
MVFVIDPAPGAGGGPTTGSVRPVAVSLGAAVGGRVEVRDGLEPGRLVVVRGNERLRSGAVVSFVPPAAGSATPEATAGDVPTGRSRP